MTRTLAHRRFLLAAATAVMATSVAGSARPQDPVREPQAATFTRLAPTRHAPLPADPAGFLLTPSSVSIQPPLEGFAHGVALFYEGKYAAALPLVSASALASTPLAGWARYYTGVTQLRLDRLEQAAETLDDLDDENPVGYLGEAVPLREAEVALARGNASLAVSKLEDLTRETVSAPEEVLLRIARASQQAGQLERARLAYRRVYFEFALTPQAEAAGSELTQLDGPAFLAPDRFKLELGRAERLFGAKRYDTARMAFSRLATVARGDDKELVALRLAESDYYLKRYRASRDALRPYIDDSSREAEARFFYLTATRALGDRETYVALARKLIVDFPQESWTEETLNNLASHYIIEDDDAEADRVFRELWARFPQSRYSERAAWKIGWLAYRNGEFDETATIFETAAVRFPRADLRPAWLYWAARAHDQLGRQELAVERYQLTVTDYQNSYYGRRASQRLAARNVPAPPAPPLAIEAASGASVPTGEVIRQLSAIGLYDEALRELTYAQRVWGDSPALQATVAWVTHHQGLGMTSWDRFDRVRGALNMMKRAYPQYITAGGEYLPPEVLSIIFPLDYWPLIKKYSDHHGLDEYTMAALIAQESTFTRDVRSPAKAVGLMQLVPPTARRVARQLGIRYSASILTQPETNIRMGMKYFDDMTEKFGGAYFAMASYNAGPDRVARWKAEKPDLEEDEFIDDIPFPETQNYVKKIIGTAEDYRRLYGGGMLLPGGAPGPKAAAPAPAAKKLTPKSAPKKPAPKKPAPRLPRRR